MLGIASSLVSKNGFVATEEESRKQAPARLHRGTPAPATARDRNVAFGARPRGSRLR
jgi:hypothetical protein